MLELDELASICSMYSVQCSGEWIAVVSTESLDVCPRHIIRKSLAIPKSAGQK